MNEQRLTSVIKKNISVGLAVLHFHESHNVIGSTMGNSIQSLLFQPPESSYGCDQNLIWLQTRRNQRIACFHLNRNVWHLWALRLTHS